MFCCVQVICVTSSVGVCWRYRNARRVVRHIVRDVSRSSHQTLHLHTRRSWFVAAVAKSASNVRCWSPAIILATTSPRGTRCASCVHFSSAARWPSPAARRRQIWSSWQWRPVMHQTVVTVRIKNMPAMWHVWRSELLYIFETSDIFVNWNWNWNRN